LFASFSLVKNKRSAKSEDGKYRKDKFRKSLYLEKMQQLSGDV